MADSLIVAMLKHDEGCKLIAYFDSLGNLTAGFGHLVLPEDGIKHGDAITQEQADEWLANDLETATDDATDAFYWLQTLNEPRQAVIVAMAYNMGINRLLEFTNTLKAVQAHDWQAAHDGMLKSLWAEQVGDRADRLAYIMLTGDASYYLNL